MQSELFFTGAPKHTHTALHRLHACQLSTEVTTPPNEAHHPREWVSTLHHWSQQGHTSSSHHSCSWTYTEAPHLKHTCTIYVTVHWRPARNVFQPKWWHITCSIRTLKSPPDWANPIVSSKTQVQLFTKPIFQILHNQNCRFPLVKNSQTTTHERGGTW